MSLKTGGVKSELLKLVTDRHPMPNEQRFYPDKVPFAVLQGSLFAPRLRKPHICTAIRANTL